MTMLSSLSQDVTLRVRLALAISEDDVPFSYYQNKRLELLKLQSAHDTGSNNYNVDAEESVELPSSISDFITYFIRKIYVGSNNNRSSTKSCISNQYDRNTDLHHLKILIQTYAPDLEEACIVYHVAGDETSFAKIRQGFRNAEATPSPTVKVVLCANESADVPIMPNGMNTGDGRGGDVIDFILSVKYGHRPGTANTSKANVCIEGGSKEDSEDLDRDKVDSEEVGSEVVSQVENDQIGNDNSDRQESIDDNQSNKRNNPEDANSTTRYPSK